MSENCDHNCAGCTAGCAERTPGGKLRPGELSEIRHTVAVMSGKGGVGKSTVTALLAVLLQRMGYRVGILDADLTGPSIPRMFGVRDCPEDSEYGLFPVPSKLGTEILSVGLMLESETAPLIWRGALLAGQVKNFFTEAVWNDLDFLLIDTPPGTGDVAQAVLSDLPLSGVVAVTAPQELSGMMTEKSLRLAEKLSVPVLALVENMSAYVCPECGKTHPLFGRSHTGALAERHGIDLLATLPLSAKLAAAGDKGMIELFEGDWLDAVAEKLAALAGDPPTP